MVPAFALISALAGWPLSLLEVGASAGLNLRFDSYRFVYRSRDVLISVGDDRSPVRVDGEFEGDTRAIPESMPPIAKRVGLDIDPIDLGDPLQVRWLRACVWADAVDRDRRLQAAISLAQAEPPVVLRGDASVDLERVAAGLAPDVPLVVMHQAVMTYLSASARHRVRAAIRGLACRRPVFWLLSEDPAIAQMLTGVDTSSITTGAHHVLVLTDFTRDVPASAVLAHADPHGRWLRWLAPAYDGDLSRLFKGP